MLSAFVNRAVLPQNHFYRQTSSMSTVECQTTRYFGPRDNDCTCRCQWTLTNMNFYYAHRFILSALQLIFVLFVSKTSKRTSFYCIVKAYGNVLRFIRKTISRTASERMKLFQSQVLMVAVGFALCWLPRNVMLMIMCFFPVVTQSNGFLLAMRFCIVLCHAHPTITAIAYVVSGKKYSLIL